MRPSGTEPVVRVYTEAATPAASQKLAEKARAWVTQ
jgi:phosphomannomutase